MQTARDFGTVNLCETVGDRFFLLDFFFSLSLNDYVWDEMEWGKESRGVALYPIFLQSEYSNEKREE